MSDSAKSVMLDLVYVQRFITLLLKDFKDWDAFKLGIIDENGDIVKLRRHRKSSQDRKAFTKFHKVVLTVKKTLNRVSSSKVVSTVAAIALLKEHCEEEGVDYRLMESRFMKHLQDEHNINYTNLLEDVPTNSTATVANPELTRYTKPRGESDDINIIRRGSPTSTEKNKKKKKVGKTNGRDIN